MAKRARQDATSTRRGQEGAVNPPNQDRFRRLRARSLLILERLHAAPNGVTTAIAQVLSVLTHAFFRVEVADDQQWVGAVLNQLITVESQFEFRVRQDVAGFMQMQLQQASVALSDAQRERQTMAAMIHSLEQQLYGARQNFENERKQLTKRIDAEVRDKQTAQREVESWEQRHKQDIAAATNVNRLRLKLAAWGEEKQQLTTHVAQLQATIMALEQQQQPPSTTSRQEIQRSDMEPDTCRSHSSVGGMISENATRVVQEYKETLTLLRLKNEKLHTQLQTLQAQAKRIVVKYEHVLTASRAREASLTQQLHEAREQLQTATMKHTALTATLETMHSEIERERAQCETERGVAEQKRAEMARLLDEMEQKLVGEVREREVAWHTLTTQRVAVEEQETVSQQQETDRQDPHQRLAQVEGSCRDLNQQNQTLESQLAVALETGKQATVRFEQTIETLETQLQDERKQREQREQAAKHAQLNTEKILERAQSQVSLQESELLTLRERLALQTSVIQDLDAKQQVQALRSSRLVAELQQRLATRNEQDHAVKHQQEQVKQKLEDAHRKIQKLLGEIQTLTSQLTQLQADHMQCGQLMETVRQKVRATERQNRELHLKLEALELTELDEQAAWATTP